MGLLQEPPGASGPVGAGWRGAFGGESSLVRAPRPAPDLAEQAGWRAELSLTLARRGVRTVLAHARHLGPLRVQRAFYPEPEGACHLYVLHPPGGIASADVLRIEIAAGPDSAALVTTPGAGKLYRSRGASAQVSQHLVVDAGACLEWFPQETIAFSGAEAELSTHIELAPNAVYAGWDILCLGRPACAERFARGRIVGELSLARAGQLRFRERAEFAGDDPVLREAWGLGGAPVLGSFVVAHPQAEESWLELLREGVEAREGLFAATLVSGVLVARYLGHSTLDARACFERMFALLRPYYAGRPAVPPRIWRT